jgi:hypothetical protein
MPSGWLLLTFGSDRQYSGNAGYEDELATVYRYDSFVQNSRRLAKGDVVVLRDRDAMLGVASIEQIVSRRATKTLRRCPTCTTTQFDERRTRTPRFRCKRGHEFAEPTLDLKECEEFEARFGNSFRTAPGLISIADLRAACPRYTDQLSMQVLDLDSISEALRRAGVLVDLRQVLAGSVLGASYRAADETISVAERDPFEVDPQVVERGTRSHATIQNALAAFLVTRGLEPRSPCGEEPEYDLAWSDGTTTFVSEVKSTTNANEEKQLRHGLGQVLRYRHVMQRQHGVVVAVLAIERAPVDESWIHLCQSLGVLLVWPDHFHAIPPVSTSRCEEDTRSHGRQPLAGQCASVGRSTADAAMLRTYLPSPHAEKWHACCWQSDRTQVANESARASCT